MNITEHFTLAEMTHTSHGEYADEQLDGAMDRIEELSALCEMLELVRAHFGAKILIHSGYRSLALNAAIGGSKTSQHMRGQAADFHVDGHTLNEVYDWIRHSGIKVGQLILEGSSPNAPSWIHISTPTTTIHDQYLTFDGRRYHTAAA